jgi:enoyl-CoA hydratase/carnithine racemase
MLFLGERYDAATLHRLGVAWRVVPDEQLVESAEQVARQLAALPPLSVRAMKRVLNETATTNIRTALDRETRATIAGFMDPETTRLLQAF